MYQVYDRISDSNGEHGTVKFIGNVHTWGDKVKVLGIEWDNPLRGKNNGFIDGVKYLETEVEGACSFVKADSKKIILSNLTFINVLETQYSSNFSLHSDIIFGSKIAEGFGFAKLNNLQADFFKLTSISLEKKGIRFSGNSSDEFEDIISSLRSLKKLDLSFNLFNSFNDIWDILNGVPTLEWLNINGNRLNYIPLKLSKGVQHSKLKVLKVAATKIRPDTISRLVTNTFPHLRELSLAGNYYSDKDVIDLNFKGSSLESIDLSYNALKKVPSIDGSKIKSINLSNNKIHTIDEKWDDLIEIDLRNNIINDWSVIVEIQKKYKNLKSIKINGNPLFSSISVDEMTLFLIALLGFKSSKDSSVSLESLNGSLVSEDEVTNSELYFISSVQKGIFLYNTDNKRWHHLLEKYKINSQVRGMSIDEGFATSRLISLRIWFNGNISEKSFLRNMSVLRFKGILSKRTGQPFYSISVYFHVNEFEEESENKIRRYLDNNLSTLDNYGLSMAQTLFVEIT